MNAARPLRFYCDESGNTGTHWLDAAQPVLVHGGWLFPDDTEAAVAAGVQAIRQKHRIQAPELKWAQFASSGRARAFREIVELCLKNGVLPMFMVMDKRYAVAAKIVETFFDPQYNLHLPMEFSGDFETKKGIAEAVFLSADLVDAFGPWLRSGGTPQPSDVTELARSLATHLRTVGIPSLAGTLGDLRDSAIAELRSEFSADAMMRSTTWTVLWAMAMNLLQFVRAQEREVQILQDELVRFQPLIDMIGQQPGVAKVELVDSKLHLGVQVADLLCGFLRTVFEKLMTGTPLETDERATCADLFMLQQEFESWNGNLPERTWVEFVKVAIPELKRRYGTTPPNGDGTSKAKSRAGLN